MSANVRHLRPLYAFSAPSPLPLSHAARGVQTLSARHRGRGRVTTPMAKTSSGTGRKSARTSARPVVDPSVPKRVRQPASTGALSQADKLTPLIQWYPGHIAKAERALRDAIKLVDVVIEVRDCRIPKSTAHPDVPSWVGDSRMRVLAMNRADLAPEAGRAVWRSHLLDTGERVRFVDAKHGRGVSQLKKLAATAGDAVNQKRAGRGLLPRPVRALVMGYPNVGKSALINRLVGRNTAKSANKPGVTRNFQWVRLGGELELLDMPGIIPMRLDCQEAALRLAICDDIGQGAYDSQTIAAMMVDELKRVAAAQPRLFALDTLHERFRTDSAALSGEEFLEAAAQKVASGDMQRTAERLLKEFRSGVLGPATLEWPLMDVDVEDEVGP